MHTTLPMIVLLAGFLPAQNLLPNGEFEQGAARWSVLLESGTFSGFAPARVSGNGPSMAVFSTMPTPGSSMMTACYTWRYSALCALPAGTFPISFRVMWDVAAQLSPPTGSAVSLIVYENANSNNTAVFSTILYRPNPAPLVARSAFSGTVTVPGGIYWVSLSMLHGAWLAGTAVNTIWVDDIVLGAPVTFAFGQGCPGSGGFVPVINTVNWPQRNTSTFAIELHDARAPGLTVFALDWSRTSTGSVLLPYALGGGCSLYVGTSVLSSGAMSGSGAGQGATAQALSIPNLPLLAGQQLFAQWGVADPGAMNPWQLATTAAVGFTIQ